MFHTGVIINPGLKLLEYHRGILIYFFPAQPVINPLALALIGNKAGFFEKAQML